MKVLMATDGSKEAMTAITSAARLLRKKDLEVDLLCVAPHLKMHPESGRTGHSRLHETYAQKITRESERIVRRAQHGVQKEGIDVKTIVGIGSPADEIIKRALDYDLVVVGAYGKYE